MSQRNSGYVRKTDDFYETPDWVVEAVIPHIPAGAGKIWEPACGGGNIVRVLADQGYDVYATDASNGEDFFTLKDTQGSDGILTNPPYTDVAVFVQHAIDLMMPRNGFVLLLLSNDFDSAHTRRNLFADCPIFRRKIVLTKRIVWIKRTDGKKAAPSANHAWYLWSWRHGGPATLAWEP